MSLQNSFGLSANLEMLLLLHRGLSFSGLPCSKREVWDETTCHRDVSLLSVALAQAC
jgi:hypothetical protein